MIAVVVSSVKRFLLFDGSCSGSETVVWRSNFWGIVSDKLSSSRAYRKTEINIRFYCFGNRSNLHH